MMARVQYPKVYLSRKKSGQRSCSTGLNHQTSFESQTYGFPAQIKGVKILRIIASYRTCHVTSQLNILWLAIF